MISIPSPTQQSLRKISVKKSKDLILNSRMTNRKGRSWHNALIVNFYLQSAWSLIKKPMHQKQNRTRRRKKSYQGKRTSLQTYFFMPLKKSQDRFSRLFFGLSSKKRKESKYSRKSLKIF